MEGSETPLKYSYKRNELTYWLVVGPVALIALILLAGMVFAVEYPALKPYVNDYANVLSTSDINALNAEALDIDNCTGVEIAIVTMTSLDGQDPFNYAQHLGDAAGIGKKGLDNGVVVLWVVDVQRGAIATASGAKEFVDNLAVQRNTSVICVEETIVVRRRTTVSCTTFGMREINVLVTGWLQWVR